MKITLHNFRCYEDSTFTFDDGKLLLLSGPSGAGKTSILMGIHFALFGTGTKLVKHGKTSCAVTLEIGDLVIRRTKRPNRLVVNDVYEDEAAQHVINKTFGSAFRTTGYVTQDGKDAFILMSPLEKLAFLERFTFQDVDLHQLKKKGKALLKVRQETLLRTTSKLELATSMLEQTPCPEPVPYPLPGKPSSTAIKNEHTRLKNARTLLSRAKKRYEVVSKEYHALELLQASLATLRHSIQTTTEDLSRVSVPSEYAGDDALESLRETLGRIVRARKRTAMRQQYTQDQHRLEVIRKEEAETIENELAALQSWGEYTKEEATDIVSDYRDMVKDLESLDALKHATASSVQVLEEQVETLRKDVSSKQQVLHALEVQQHTYTCPSCRVSLRFDDTKQLVETDTVPVPDTADMETVRNELRTLSKTLRKTERQHARVHADLSKADAIRSAYDEELPTLTQAREDLQSMLEYIQEQRAIDRRRKELMARKGTESATVRALRVEVERMKRELDTEEDTDDEDRDEETLRADIRAQEHARQEVQFAMRRRQDLQETLSTLRDRVSQAEDTHIRRFKKVRAIEKVRAKRDSLTKDMEALEAKERAHLQNVSAIERYERYRIDHERYTHLNEQVSTLSAQEQKDRKACGAMQTLLKTILEAESIAMANVIQSINTHAQTFLDCFFPDHPILVKLLPFKEGKKGTKKPQINLQVEYKGMEADLNMLSGGEKSRVVLAFALALGEMFNTPLMLLDECTANLDQELTGEVMDGIREHFPDKLVVVIAHQVVAGAFDHVICVE